ncbi:glycosyltransferase family 4 protein [Salipiger sp. P9]|uniref:glycosyltransferase family 4 protein n=1 Tax=Salipiger pentaromativorans TaxID=2943193 RepID=UPI0021571B63|nr:glycosyltransferase family 4 protein [Salipiger pentaromativorans]MCR8549472.1 glycosyltransferase family 4 protein [Salipiger pentaromativorans]
MQATILFVVPRFHTNLYFATKALVEAGARVAVWGSSSGGAEDHSHVTPQVFRDPSDIAAMTEAWRALNPDIAFLRNSAKLRFAAARIGRRQGTALWSYDLHPYHRHEPFSRRFYLWRKGLPIRRVTASLGLESTPPDRWARYLPWPVVGDPPPPMPDRSSAGGPVTVLCVAKLARKRKMQHLVIDGMRAAGRAGKARLILIGSERESELAEDMAHYAALKAEAASEDWIEMRGLIPYAEMPALYAQSGICILPSFDEPLGFAPAESMAFGCVPVISTEAGSAGYIREGENGLLVDPHDPATVETALTRLIDDAALRLRLGQGARETALGELGPARFVERMQGLIAEG